MVWSAREEEALLAAVRKHGEKWARITQDREFAMVFQPRFIAKRMTPQAEQMCLRDKYRQLKAAGVEAHRTSPAQPPLASSTLANCWAAREQRAGGRAASGSGSGGAVRTGTKHSPLDLDDSTSSDESCSESTSDGPPRGDGPSDESEGSCELENRRG